VPPDHRRLFAALAQELRGARADLEGLADGLCADEAVVMRHVAALQTLDEVGQRLAAIAQCLDAADPVASARAITLEKLRNRLDLGMAA